MGYYGNLRANEDSGPGLAVRIDISADTVVLLDASDILGSWEADEVSIERLDGDVFRLDLGQETFFFESTDRLSFGYEGLQKLADAQSNLNRGLRGRMRRRRRHASSPAKPAAPLSNLMALSDHQHPDADQVTDPTTKTSAAAVFARGYQESPEVAPAPRPTKQPTSDFPEAAEPAEAVPSPALIRDEAMAALSSIGGAAEGVNGSATPLREKLASSLNGDNPIPALPGRAQEDVRSPRLEKEEAISHAKPPADPWENTGQPSRESPPPPPAPSPLHASEAADPPNDTEPSSSDSPSPAPAAPNPSTADPTEIVAPDKQDADAPDTQDAVAPELPVEANPAAAGALGTNTTARPDKSELVIDLTETSSGRTLMDRFRMRRRHEHTYAEDTVSGGIVRRVCSECHHVSIGAS